MVFGKASLNGKVEAEIEFWRNKLEERIRQNLGSVTSSLDCEETIVILPTCTKSSDQIVTQIKALIEIHRVAEAKFNSMHITEESQLVKALDQQLVGAAHFTEELFSVVRNVFKMFVQNDASIYY